MPEKKTLYEGYVHGIKLQYLLVRTSGRHYIVDVSLVPLFLLLIKKGSL